MDACDYMNEWLEEMGACNAGQQWAAANCTSLADLWDKLCQPSMREKCPDWTFWVWDALLQDTEELPGVKNFQPILDYLSQQNPGIVLHALNHPVLQEVGAGQQTYQSLIEWSQLDDPMSPQNREILHNTYENVVGIYGRMRPVTDFFNAFLLECCDVSPDSPGGMFSSYLLSLYLGCTIAVHTGLPTQVGKEYMAEYLSTLRNPFTIREE